MVVSNRPTIVHVSGANHFAFSGYGCDCRRASACTIVTQPADYAPLYHVVCNFLRLLFPLQSLDKLYAQVGDAVVDSINDVPFMFRGPRRSGQQQQRTRPLRRTGTGTVRGFQGTRRAGRGATAGGRAVLDVAMPGVYRISLFVYAWCGQFEIGMCVIFIIVHVHEKEVARQE